MLISRFTADWTGVQIPTDLRAAGVNDVKLTHRICDAICENPSHGGKFTS